METIWSVGELHAVDCRDHINANRSKAADRLLANRHLHAERAGIYRAIARTLLAGTRRPVVIVDWSDLEPRRQWLEALGWDWVGRIRNKIKYYDASSERWRYTDTLYREATARVRHIGEVSLSPRHGYRFRMYLVRAYKPSRPQPRRGERAKCAHARTYRRLHRAPWLIATSLPHGPGSSRQIKQLYAQRMQIEETLRDVKSHRWGFGLHYARCNDGRRLEVLLSIGALAALVLWLVGLCGRALDWTLRLQANTERRRPVLSTVFIGRQLLRRSTLELSTQALDLAMADLRALIKAAMPTNSWGSISDWR